MIEKNWMTLIKPKKLNIKVDEKNPNIAIGYDRHKKARYSKLKKEIRRLKREGKDPIKEYRNKDFVVYFG